MDELAKRIAELADKINQSSPQALEAARGAVVVETYSQLMMGTLFLIIGAIMAKAAVFCWNKFQEDDDNLAAMAVTIFLAPGSTVLILIGIWAWIDPWTWTAMHHPDLWMAKKILRL